MDLHHFCTKLQLVFCYRLSHVLGCQMNVKGGNLRNCEQINFIIILLLITASFGIMALPLVLYFPSCTTQRPQKSYRSLIPVVLHSKSLYVVSSSVTTGYQAKRTQKLIWTPYMEKCVCLSLRGDTQYHHHLHTLGCCSFFKAS
jgi:hypothetical protein